MLGFVGGAVMIDPKGSPSDPNESFFAKSFGENKSPPFGFTSPPTAGVVNVAPPPPKKSSSRMFLEVFPMLLVTGELPVGPKANGSSEVVAILLLL